MSKNNGIFSGSSPLLLMLGLAPALGSTAFAETALAMGIVTFIVLAVTGLALLLLRAVPETGKVVLTILIAAALTTVADYVLTAKFAELRDAMGIYLPLAAVSSVILLRAGKSSEESSAASVFVRGTGTGILFIIALFAIGSVREILSVGTWFGLQVMPEGYEMNYAMMTAPGALLAAGFLAAVLNVRACRGTSDDGKKEGES